jgi:LytTr DNA-binding domain
VKTVTSRVHRVTSRCACVACLHCAAMAMPPDTLLKRYLALRQPAEVLFWVLLMATEAAVNTAVVLIEMRRSASATAAWEVATWEVSSNLVGLALVPFVVWVLDRKPVHWGVLRQHLLWHLGAACVFCLLHVVGMVLLRKMVYANQGSHYDFGSWRVGLLYEALKDLRSYLLIATIVLSYRLLLWRWQGEARWLSDADESPATAPPLAAVKAVPSEPPLPRLAPERILVKKLGKEFLLQVSEIEWVQACGNYVNMHRQQHDYPLRATLAAVEKQLHEAGFVRVHRSYLVNLALVHVIEPTEAGDANLRMRDGSAVPCSRTHLDALRQRLNSSLTGPAAASK